MALHVPAMFRSLFDGKNDLAKLATGGAWLFAIGSLMPLLWLITDGGADGAVFRANVDGRSHTIPLLTYSGGIGMLLIWSEILAVAGAFILTAAPRVPLKLARIGHGVLIAWSLLWTLGTWRLSAFDPGFWTFQAIFLTSLCGCTIWRALKNWLPPVAQAMAVDATTNDEANYFSDTRPAPVESAADASTPTRQQIAEALERARIAAVAAGRRIVVGVKAGINAARKDSAKI